MGFFKKPGTNVAVVDIHSSSIGAAYVAYREKTPPTVVYSVRMPLEMHATEPLMEALPRVLEAVMKQLVTEGAPALRSHTGSGKADFTLVAFAAPWQHSSVFSKVVEHEKPFTFSRQVLDAALRESATAVPTGKEKVSDMLIATLLNGYEVQDPFGKKAKRAELILLSSSIDTEVMDLVRKMVRKALHQHQVYFNAFLPEAYVAMRQMYPEHRDFVVLDVGGEATDIMLAKHGLLVSLTCLGHGVNEIARVAHASGVSSLSVPLASDGGVIDASRNVNFASRVEAAEAAWRGEMRASLAEVVKLEPLPRMVFLIADEHVREFLKRLFDVPEIRALWLSEEALALMPLLPQQFAPFLGSENADGVDPSLALLALSAEQRLA